MVPPGPLATVTTRALRASARIKPDVASLIRPDELAALAQEHPKLADSLAGKRASLAAATKERRAANHQARKTRLKRGVEEGDQEIMRKVATRKEKAHVYYLGRRDRERELIAAGDEETITKKAELKERWKPYQLEWNRKMAAGKKEAKANGTWVEPEIEPEKKKQRQTYKNKWGREKRAADKKAKEDGTFLQTAAEAQKEAEKKEERKQYKRQWKQAKKLKDAAASSQPRSEKAKVKQVDVDDESDVEFLGMT